MMQKIKIKLGSRLELHQDLAQYFLGYPLRKYYSPLDLKSYVSNNIVVRKFSRSSKKL